jgi:hypothetical protein
MTTWGRGNNSCLLPIMQSIFSPAVLGDAVAVTEILADRWAKNALHYP